jgi:hypothetical protein
MTEMSAATIEARQIASKALELMAVQKAKTRNAEKEFEETHPYDYNRIAGDIRDRYHVLSFKKTLYRYHDVVYVEDDGFVDSEITN